MTTTHVGELTTGRKRAIPGRVDQWRLAAFAAALAALAALDVPHTESVLARPAAAALTLAGGALSLAAGVLIGRGWGGARILVVSGALAVFGGVIGMAYG